MHQELIIGVLAGAALAGALAFFLVKVKRLPPERALALAVRYAYEIWEALDFASFEALRDKGVSRKQLLEIGLLLRSLVAGEVSEPNLSVAARAAHPELSNVNPLELAQRVQALVEREAI